MGFWKAIVSQLLDNSQSRYGRYESECFMNEKVGESCVFRRQPAVARAFCRLP
jgi:hypothetical protein